MPEIISKKEAKAAGLSKFFTGCPCRVGHIAERYLCDGNCTECVAKRARDWYRDNHEHALATKAAYRKANPETNCAQTMAAWRANNPERARQNSETWYQNNKERCSENAKVWARANPGRKAVYDRNRRARIAGNGGTHTAEDIGWLYEIQEGRCGLLWCRKELEDGFHVDHVIPLVLDGRNDRHNLQLLCSHCNLSKNDTHPIEFALQHGYLC